MRVLIIAPLRLITIAVMLLVVLSLVLPFRSSDAQGETGDLLPERTVAAPGGDTALAMIDEAGSYLMAPVQTTRPFSHLVIGTTRRFHPVQH